MEYSIQDYSILDKKRLVRQLCKGQKATFLCYQIRVCEDLCLPLTEEHIKEFAKLSLKELTKAITRHKKMF